MGGDGYIVSAAAGQRGWQRIAELRREAKVGHAWWGEILRQLRRRTVCLFRRSENTRAFGNASCRLVVAGAIFGLVLAPVPAWSASADPLQAGVAGPDWCRSPTLAGWVEDAVWHELATTFTLLDGVQVHVNAPAEICTRRAAPTRLVLYALPNGNSIAWTVGKRVGPGDDWHFGIQHIGAQTRLARKLVPEENLVVAYAEAPGRSWPAWRRKHGEEAGRLARELVVQVAGRLSAWRPQIELMAHSGGGSLLFAYIEGGDELSSEVRRLVFLDANYGFSAEAGHGAKLARWLQGSPERLLVVAAYDDREVMLNGKAVVGPTGGTWRATERMIADLARFDGLTTVTAGELVGVRGFGDRLRVALHRNSERRILHSVLVERNGFVWGVLAGTPAEAKGPAFFSEPAYGKFLAGGSGR